MLVLSRPCILMHASRCLESLASAMPQLRPHKLGPVATLQGAWSPAHQRQPSGETDMMGGSLAGTLPRWNLGTTRAKTLAPHRRPPAGPHSVRGHPLMMDPRDSAWLGGGTVRSHARGGSVGTGGDAALVRPLHAGGVLWEVGQRRMQAGR